MIHIAPGWRWSEVVAGLRDDASFRTALAAQLRAAPYEAWFWECNRVSDGPFEYVVIDAPALARIRADAAAFAAHLTAPVNTFSSLGRDATLIAPSQTGDHGHFAAFLRAAPADQVDALFHAIGDAIAGWSRPAAPWVSTAGMGVPWLHVRLDSRPKYYRHAPYRAGQ